MDLHLVKDFGELQALTPAWRELLAASAADEPMQSPAWLLTWWQIYGADTGRLLRVGLFYEQNRLVGLAPFCLRRFHYRPGIPFTRLEFLGSDVDEQDGVCSIYLNLLARAGLEKRVAEAFVGEMVQGSFGPWSEVVLSAMNGDQPMCTFLLEAFRTAGYEATQQTTTQAPYLTLSFSWDGYLQSLNKKHRRNVKHTLQTFEAWAGTDWKLEEARTDEEFARGQQVLAALHTQRWQQGETNAGAFAAPRFEAFHHAYMPLAFRDNKLQLLWLTVRGEPIVAHYQLISNNKVYFYQCGRSLTVPDPVRPASSWPPSRCARPSPMAYASTIFWAIRLFTKCNSRRRYAPSSASALPAAARANGSAAAPRPPSATRAFCVIRFANCARQTKPLRGNEL